MTKVLNIDALHAHLRGEHSVTREEGCAACSQLPPISETPPRRAAPDPPRPVTHGAANVPTGTCWCGCGEPVTRRFRPGHDAKLKSQLMKQIKSPITEVSVAATSRMNELGWGHLIK